MQDLLISFKLKQDCCLIPESPFYLEGKGGLFEFVEQRLKENRHVVIVVAEGAGQEYLARSMYAIDEKDASGNRLLLDVGLWLTQNFKVCSIPNPNKINKYIVFLKKIKHGQLLVRLHIVR